ncbi:MAG: ABC transporter permease, partial [Sphingobacteriales bacterium]
MSANYNNTQATLALAKASFRSILRSPSAVVFTLAFPMIFILVFGFLGGSGIKVDIALEPGSDLNNPVILSLKKMEMVRLVENKTKAEIDQFLLKGNYDAVIDVRKNKDALPAYLTNVKYTSASADKGNIIRSLLNNLMYELNTKDIQPAVTEIRETTIKGRAYSTIDFISLHLNHQIL